MTSRDWGEENDCLYDLQVVMGGFFKAACEMFFFSQCEVEDAEKSNSDLTDLYQSLDRSR